MNGALRPGRGIDVFEFRRLLVSDIAKVWHRRPVVSGCNSNRIRVPGSGCKHIREPIEPYSENGRNGDNWSSTGCVHGQCRQSKRLFLFEDIPLNRV